ncbi:MAG: hypothetical protein H0X31_05225 [Nostocaceae cyanobacterium]|nr:hypothetical protein [Nostocaceae cyanobacterium]
MNSPKTEYPVGQNLKEIYEQVFNELRSQIEDKEKGVLCRVIHIILDPEELQAQYICKRFQIYTNELDDDLSISLDIIGIFTSSPNDEREFKNNRIDTMKEGMKEGIKNPINSINSNWQTKDTKLFQIVVIGCVIVGTFACLKYLEKTKQKPRVKKGRKSQVSDSSLQNQPLDSSPPKQRDPRPVALCLIVPASVVGNARENQQINISNIETLIDNSSYFLCTSPQDANTIQERLEITRENITSVSEQREIYIRINITDGEEMVGKKVLYSLKINLPSEGQSIVGQLACLKYLSVSGLEKFNRV